MSKTGGDPGLFLTSLARLRSSLDLSLMSRLVVDKDLSLMVLVEASWDLTISSLATRSSPRNLRGCASFSLKACSKIVLENQDKVLLFRW